MAKKSAYASDVEKHDLQLINELLAELPPFVKTFMNSRSINTSSRTRKNYCYSIRRFLLWWHDSVPELMSKPLTDMTVDDIAKVTARDVEEFIGHIQNDPFNPLTNATVAQKLAALYSLFEYFCRHDDIPYNPVTVVSRPKLIRDKRIEYMDDDEVRRFLDVIENGSNLMTPRHRAYLANTRIRDYTIAIILLNTGIRVSECAGLDVTDINLKARQLQVYRKGGKYQYIPFGDETADALKTYIKYRKKLSPEDPKDKKALFLSSQNRRLTVSSIEVMIKKYAQYAGIYKNITPHKLRKTYGTALYQHTRDIYLVANALGHDSVVTATKHYVNDKEDSLREAVQSMDRNHTKIATP